MGGAWLTYAGKQCKRGSRRSYRASVQVRHPRACKVPGGDASKHQHLSMLPSFCGGAGSSSCRREPWAVWGVPPIHTQHLRFRHGDGVQEGPSPSIPSQLQVQHLLNTETGSERRAKCWPRVFTSFVLKVCSFSHFNPARQAAMPKDGWANPSCLLYGGTGINTAQATKVPRSPTGERWEAEVAAQKWRVCHPTNLKSDLKP